MVIVYYLYTWQTAIGIGSVHHVAWRTPTDEQQKALRKNLVKVGLNATPVIDRLFSEIATNPPGFTIDENLNPALRTFSNEYWY